MTNIILILAGLFTIGMCVANPDWYFNTRKAQFWISIFGREGARWALGILGAIITLIGFFASGS
jgi:hypothetical protein